MSTRRFINTGTLLLALLALGFVHGCSARRIDSNPAEAVALAPADEARALQAFEDLGCPICHGDLGQGQEEVAPPLRSLAPYWNAERLSTYILNPDWFRSENPDFDERRETEYDMEMPSYEAASEEQRALLARWLMTR